MIRPAKQEDLRRIIEMAERFYPFTSYNNKSKIPFDVDTTAMLTSTMIDNHVVLVAEVEEKVVGVIGLVLMPFMFNPEYIHAGEILWWVEPEHICEGLGRQLLCAAEQACRDKNVTHIQMIDIECSAVQAEGLYRSEGYELTERSFTKVL